MSRLDVIGERPGAAWHAAGPLVARLAEGPAQVGALERLARRAARLAEVCPQAPPPEDLVVEGARAALFVRPAAGAAPTPPRVRG